MFRVARMAMVDILVLEAHAADLVRSLGEAGFCELVRQKGARNVHHDRELEEISKRIEQAEGFARAYPLKPSGKTDKNPLNKADMEEAHQTIERLTAALLPLQEAAEREEQRQEEIRTTLNTIVGFKSLEIELSVLHDMTHVSLRYGCIPEPRLAPLLEKNTNALILPLDFPTDEQGKRVILAASSRTGRFALETLLAEAGFQDMPLPVMSGKSDVIARRLEESLKESKETSGEIAGEKEKILAEGGGAFIRALALLKQRQFILLTLRGFACTTSTAHIRCWIERSRLGALEKLVRDATEGTGVVEDTDPLSLPHAEREKLDIPVVLKNNRFLKPFETLISSYGYPRYGEIEPTPLVALGFIAMFGVMFGDVGQGFVLFLAGLGLLFKKSLSPSIRQTGVVVAAAGVSAMIFGLIFGSFFCLEGVVHPLWREPLADYGNVMILFTAAIVFGALWISLGLLCNIINRFSTNDMSEALLGKTGLAGLAFYWGALIPIGLALGEIADNISIDTVVLAAGIPLLFIVAREPIWNAVQRKRAFPHGVGSWIFEAIIEVIDTVSYYFGNTFSFIRVGAFALSHAGLSLAVIELAKLGGGGVMSVLAMIGGNLLIIVLEGMVVTIQSLRLEYYEFFSKFYSGSGRVLMPFKLPAFN